MRWLYEERDWVNNQPRACQACKSLFDVEPHQVPICLSKPAVTQVSIHLEGLAMTQVPIHPLDQVGTHLPTHLTNPAITQVSIHLDDPAATQAPISLSDRPCSLERRAQATTMDFRLYKEEGDWLDNRHHAHWARKSLFNIKHPQVPIHLNGPAVT